MPLENDNIQISSDVGTEKEFLVYFPTIVYVGQTADYVSDTLVSSEIGVEAVSFVDATSEHFVAYLGNTSIVDTISTYYSDTNTNFGTDYLATKISYGTTLITDTYTTINEFKSKSYKIEWLNVLDVDFYSYYRLLSSDYNVINYFKIYKGAVEYSSDILNVFYISKSKMYSFYQDVYCTDENIVSLNKDVEVGRGRISYIEDDVYSTTKGTKYIYNDVYSSNYSILNINCDIEDTNGRLTNILNDVYSTKLNLIDYIKNDIRLNSLIIDNFSLHYNDYMFFGDYLYVDMLDYIFEINTSNSYFELDGQPLTTLFEDISNGVRARCVVDNEFISNSELVIKIVAENTIGDKYFETFKLLFGYNVGLSEKIVFEYNKEILVRSCATNEVQCPNSECNSFVFTTGDYPSYNLSASISCVVSDDLPAEIVPQSTAFFYGRSYRVIISGVKDYSGNEMPATEIQFTIEEK